MFILQPTYGTPVTDGLAQLRIYNGYDCNFTLNMPPSLNTTDYYMIGPLGVYEKLDIEAHQIVQLPYSLQGVPNSACEDLKFNAVFNLKEKTANSYFITNKEIYSFIDNNNKAIDGVNVR